MQKVGIIERKHLIRSKQCRFGLTDGGYSMTSPRPRIRFTYEDYRNTPEDKRYELIDGELLLVPAPRTVHQRISGKIQFYLMSFVIKQSLGEVFYAPIDVVFSDTDVLQPDILFISTDRFGIITEDNIQGAPDLVIEILSPSTADRDRTFKSSLYALHGVGEYWIVDPDAQTAEVFTLGERGFERIATYGAGDVLTSPSLEGFELNLTEVF